MVEQHQQRPEIPLESGHRPLSPTGSTFGQGLERPPELHEAPIDDLVIAFDAVDQLRREQQEIDRELNSDEQERLLVERLRQRYEARGQTVTDQILREAVEALRQDRFRYEPIPRSWQSTLAGWYVDRWKWFKRLTVSLTLAGALGFGYYGLAVAPRKQAEAATGRELTTVTQSLENADEVLAPQVRELTQAARTALANSDVKLARARVSDLQLLERFQRLRETVDKTTKVAEARTAAGQLVASGSAALAGGETELANQKLTELQNLAAHLNAAYTLRVVTKGKTGVWHVPRVNEQARNYYIVVEPVGADGQLLKVPVTSEEDGTTRLESRFGLRVDELTYQQIEQDKRDNGIIENAVFGTKSAGYLEPEYQIPTLGGKIHVTP